MKHWFQDIASLSYVVTVFSAVQGTGHRWVHDIYHTDNIVLESGSGIDSIEVEMRPEIREVLGTL
jgi:hypothetical protein